MRVPFRRGSVVVRALVVALLVASFAEPASAQPEPEERIIGGEPADWQGEVPFMAAILYDHPEHGLGFGCGASVVSARWLLTAAHCITASDPSWGTMVVAVALPQGDSRLLELRSVAATHVHPDFEPDTYGNGRVDVALVRLRKPVHWVEPIVLADASHDHLETPGTELTVIGWGDTDPRPNWAQFQGPSDLQQVVVPVVDDDACDKAYKGLVSVETEVCAGERGADSCQGDSGGPLFGTVGEATVQVGVVSWGWGCAMPQWPGVYAEVNSPVIREFIADVASV